MTSILIRLMFLVWPFGHFLDINTGNGYSFSLLDSLAFFTVLLSLPSLIKHKNIFKKDKLSIYLALFFSITSLSLMLRAHELDLFGSPRPVLYLIRLIIYLSLYFVFKLHTLKKYCEYIKLSLFLFVVFGLIQYIFFPNMSYIKYLGFDDHYYRLIGALLDPNFIGAILSSLIVYLFAIDRVKLSLFLLMPLAATFSRASFISLIFPTIFYIIQKKKYKISISILILGLIVFVAPKPFGEGVNLLRTFSIYSRIDSIRYGLDLFKIRPILGWGYNALVLDGQRIGIDNSFVYILATTGILGLASFMSILWVAFRKKSFAIQMTVLSVITHSLFNNTLFYPWVLFFLAILMATDEK